MTYLQTLHLQNFRSYQELSLDQIEPKNIILFGANGAGKTNILEALSLLAPGRGLRQSKNKDLQKHGTFKSMPWTVSSRLKTHHGLAQIGTARDALKDKRLIRINGEDVRTQGALSEWLSCLWLTPQMDRLFLDDKSSRRRFFDRLAYTFDPAHMGRLTRYENAVRQRMKLLKEGQNDPSWFTGLEAQIAEAGIAISATRYNFCQKLQKAYHSATDEEKSHFPSAKLSIEGDVEKILEQQSALEAEEQFQKKLERSRAQDAQNGTTHFGSHRSDFVTIYSDKNMPAAQCSTGEQKAMLIGIILAHARLLKEEKHSAPLLLLDEIVAHLDPNRRRILAGILENYSSQVWMTGTDRSLFKDFDSQSSYFSVSESSVSVFSA